jgi:arginine repressor
MAKRKNGINKSEEIRQMLNANQKVTAKEVKDALAAKGIKVSDKLYYLVKGKMLGKQARKKKAHKTAAKVAVSTGLGSADALSTILKVKKWAGEVGGLKNLKALVEALSE